MIDILKYAMNCTGMGRISSRGEAQSQCCGADSPPGGVRQLLEDVIPGSGFCIGLSNVQVIGVQETPCVRMNWLLICIDVDLQRGNCQ